ncbi:thioredoxin domain-containing protein [bacterium]|nr:thioredoxin domain-containing protein [bacterium]
MEFLASDNFNTFVRDYSPVLGSPDAKVYITEFLDPECESCRAVYPAVKEIMKEFEGKVKLVVRYAPFHGNSVMAVRILEAARAQGKYWEALELLFEKQPEWGDHHNPRPSLIWTYLPTIGIDVERLQKDMENPIILTRLQRDVEDGRMLDVRQTPTFFVNGKPLTSFGIPQLRSLVKDQVEQTTYQ